YAVPLRELPSSPTRRSSDLKIFLRYLTGFASICSHHPNIVAATGITGKGNILAVGAKPGLYLIRNAGAKRFGLAAYGGNGIYISQQIEYDGVTIRAYIQVDPSTFICGENMFFIIPAFSWVGHIPFVRFVLCTYGDKTEKSQ